jgi:UDP-N-acetylglucosamine 2-epimerase (non-hydrolysing)
MKIAVIAGTRPEILKLAPVYRQLKLSPFQPVWIATAQHGDLADQALSAVGIKPDIVLDGGWNPRSLTCLAAGLQKQLGDWLSVHRPDAVLVQGDTATAFCGALTAHLNRIPVGHVEAGLRSGDTNNPFPEESFRRLIAPIADLHFAPTRLAKSNLLADGVAANRIWVTGNTIIDTMLAVSRQARRPKVLRELPVNDRLILLTTHRRENWGSGIVDICEAAKTLVARHKDVRIVFPIHSNPRVRETVLSKLSNVSRIHLLPALKYSEFIAVLRDSYLVLSDSGGVQEEAPSFQVPVLVLRETTERREAIDAGVASLVGTRSASIVAEASRILEQKSAHSDMATRENPFGDGNASKRIAKILAQQLIADPAREAAL